MPRVRADAARVARRPRRRGAHVQARAAAQPGARARAHRVSGFASLPPATSSRAPCASPCGISDRRVTLRARPPPPPPSPHRIQYRRVRIQYRRVRVQYRRVRQRWAQSCTNAPALQIRAGGAGAGGGGRGGGALQPRHRRAPPLCLWSHCSGNFLRVCLSVGPLADKKDRHSVGAKGGKKGLRSLKRSLTPRSACRLPRGACGGAATQGAVSRAGLQAGLQGRRALRQGALPALPAGLRLCNPRRPDRGTRSVSIPRSNGSKGLRPTEQWLQGSPSHGAMAPRVSVPRSNGSKGLRPTEQWLQGSPSHGEMAPRVFIARSV